MKIKEVAKVNELSIGRTFKFSEIEYIDTSSVTDGVIEKTQILNLKDAPSRAKRIVRKNDILISTVRPNLRHFALIKNPKPNTIASTGFAVITCKTVLPEYLYRFLTTKEYTEYLSSVAESQQSNYPAFNPSLIEETVINLPKIETQKKIAAVLSAYDDSIENNTRRIALLERMAEEIYREWFVRLRFPGHQYARFEKGVPEGWEIKTINDVCKVARGSSPRPINDDKYFIDGTIPWIKIADATASKMFIYETKEYVNEFGASFSRKLPKGSLIIAASGTLGFCIFLGVEGCVHDGWMYFTDYKNGMKPVFLYYLINNFGEHLNNLSYGAAIQNINTDILRRLPIIIPTKEILEKFYPVIDSVQDEIFHLGNINRKLDKTKNMLLARLISGKLAVENLDIRFPPGMLEKAEKNQSALDADGFV